jgi:hypothetical protein
MESCHRKYPIALKSIVEEIIAKGKSDAIISFIGAC